MIPPNKQYEERKNPESVAVWDFETEIADTIKELYRGKFVKLVEVSNRIHRRTLELGS